MPSPFEDGNCNDNLLLKTLSKLPWRPQRTKQHSTVIVNDHVRKEHCPPVNQRLPLGRSVTSLVF